MNERSSKGSADNSEYDRVMNERDEQVDNCGLIAGRREYCIEVRLNRIVEIEIRVRIRENEIEVRTPASRTNGIDSRDNGRIKGLKRIKVIDEIRST